MSVNERATTSQAKKQSAHLRAARRTPEEQDSLNRKRTAYRKRWDLAELMKSAINAAALSCIPGLTDKEYSYLRLFRHYSNWHFRGVPQPPYDRYVNSKSRPYRASAGLPDLDSTVSRLFTFLSDSPRGQALFTLSKAIPVVYAYGSAPSAWNRETPAYTDFEEMWSEMMDWMRRRGSAEWEASGWDEEQLKRLVATRTVKYPGTGVPWSALPEGGEGSSAADVADGGGKVIGPLAQTGGEQGH